MGKYRKKPVVIEARQFIKVNDSGQDMFELAEWCGGYVSERELGGFGDKLVSEIGIVIPTLEGDMWCSSGDWIIKGVNGEFYPCKPDIFEATYEKVIDWHKDQGFKDPY